MNQAQIATPSPAVLPLATSALEESGVRLLRLPGGEFHYRQKGETYSFERGDVPVRLMHGDLCVDLRDGACLDDTIACLREPVYWSTQAGAVVGGIQSSMLFGVLTRGARGVVLEFSGAGRYGRVPLSTEQALALATALEHRDSLAVDLDALERCGALPVKVPDASYVWAHKIAPCVTDTEDIEDEGLLKVHTPTGICTMEASVLGQAYFPVLAGQPTSVTGARSSVTWDPEQALLTLETPGRGSVKRHVVHAPGTQTVWMLEVLCYAARCSGVIRRLRVDED